MQTYLLESHRGSGGRTTVAGADSCVVVAHSEEDARAVAKCRYTGVSSAAWSGAKVTVLEPPADAEGFELVVAVSVSSDTLVEVHAVGEAGDSLGDIAVKAARFLNDSDEIHGAGYNSAERVLTVASSVGGDNLGDCAVFVAVYPPDHDSREQAGIPGCIKAVVHKGESLDSLQVVFAAENYELPMLAVAFGRP